MKRALFISRNLIGDGLQISPALRAWHSANPEWEITVETNNDHVTCIYTRMGVPVNIVTDAEQERYDFVHTFDPSQAFTVSETRRQHIAESYADLLGVKLAPEKGRAHLRPVFIPTPEELTEEEKGLVLVSMFSMSCTSRDKTRSLPPNKMLPWHKWHPIISYLRSEFGERSLRFLGAPTDRAPELEISEDRVS